MEKMGNNWAKVRKLLGNNMEEKTRNRREIVGKKRGKKEDIGNNGIWVVVFFLVVPVDISSTSTLLFLFFVGACHFLHMSPQDHDEQMRFTRF